eukprot:gene20117-20664_t
MEAFVDAIKNTDWQTEVNADAGAYQPDLWPEIIIPVIDVEVKYPNKDNNDYTIALTSLNPKVLLSGEIVTYEPPAPPIRSGPHRFFFLVFRQPSRIEDDDLQLFAEDFVKRARFPYVEFAQTMSFGSPVGINGFYAAWEPDYCESMHAKLNYIPPEQYRSPRQQLDISMREKTAAIEKAKKDLYEAMNFVVFEDSLEAREGFILPSLKLKKAPKVSYKCRSRGTSYSADSLFFTLVLSDPDCPSRTVHSLRELVHWLV